MPLEYRVIAFMGFSKDISKLLEELMKQITIKLNTGATLVGGINIGTIETGGTYATKIVVSQAVTYTVGQTNTIEYTNYIINEGYSFEEIYYLLKKEILSNNDISNEDKARIFMEICRSYDKIINGSSELININHVLNIINKS
jgi:DNA polymerase III delta prime subunit